MNKEGCPVCGYSEITVLDNFYCETHEICEICGTQSGLEYQKFSTIEHLNKLRHEWLYKNKGAWRGDKKSIPENWNPINQMKEAGIEIPRTTKALNKSLKSDVCCAHAV